MADPVEVETVFDDGEPYEPAVCHGEFVYVSGQHPVDSEGNVVGDDIQTQTAQVITNIERVLEAAGTTPENIIKATVFLTDMSQFEAFNAAYEELLPDPKPARSAVGVTGLAVESLLEIEVIATR